MAELVKALTVDVPGVTWGVVMTVCEPLALVRTNVLWHLATGARAVYVFFDDPQDPVLPALRDIAGCNVVACDRAHWHRLNGRKGRPASQMRRQTLNANAAQEVATTDWLFHIDADEFIWQDGDMGAELAEMRPGQTELNLPVLERLFPEKGQSGLFDGSFRATSDLSQDEAAQAFGPFADFMKRGQYSHGAGKSGVPVRQGLRMGVHNATVRGTERWKRAPKQVSATARLLHFDGVTPLHWALKFLRYRLNPSDVQDTILQPHRTAQINWMLDQGESLAELCSVHPTLFALTPQRKARLEAYDLVREVPFDPTTVLGRPGFDLSPGGFDAELLRRTPWARAYVG